MLDRVTPNPREIIGGNQPPSLIDFAKEATSALSDWLKDHPSSRAIDDARAAKACLDRAKTNLDEMETERDSLVRPLNQQVADINGRYKPVRTALETLMGELKKRLTGYAKAVEVERIRKAEEAAQAAAEAERLAREAEAREREAIEDASQGACDIDLGTITIEADAAFAAFQKANRAAARAEHDTQVRITGGFNNAISLREKETLTVTDWQAAITEIGLTDAIREAILTSARAYRKAFKELPEGITATYDRSL